MFCISRGFWFLFRGSVFVISTRTFVEMESTIDRGQDDLFAEPYDSDSPQASPIASEAEEVPMRGGGQHDNGDGDQEQMGASIQDKVKKLKAAARKKVRNPQPKLDSDRLTGERGIAHLPKIMSKMKFRGQGFEAEDLKTLMRELEHWAHRLYPKLPFDDVIERIERLGSKKSVQTVVNKIRLDMPILEEDFTGTVDINNDSDDNNDNQNGDAQDRLVYPEVDYMDDDDDDAVPSASHLVDISSDLPQHETSVSPQGESSNDLDPTSDLNSSATTLSQKAALTKEQMDRIQLNKERALQKRRERELQKTNST